MVQAARIDWRAALREGAYPASFAAKIADTTRAAVSLWLRPSDGGRLPPAILTPFDRIHGQPILSFLALVETRFVSRFRRHGLSLQTIRQAARKLRETYALDHPFANRRFQTDGKRVMMEFAAGDGERRLIDIMTDQFGFPSVIEPSLFATIVYVDDIATRFRPFDEFPNVVIDPRYALGRPVVEPGRIPTETLSAAFLAEGDVDAVADWFATDRDAVTQAVAFEQRMAA
jgi:uncharacterized protein (DUF433 family)